MSTFILVINHSTNPRYVISGLYNSLSCSNMSEMFLFIAGIFTTPQFALIAETCYTIALVYRYATAFVLIEEISYVLRLSLSGGQAMLGKHLLLRFLYMLSTCGQYKLLVTVVPNNRLANEGGCLWFVLGLGLLYMCCYQLNYSRISRISMIFLLWHSIFL